MEKYKGIILPEGMSKKDAELFLLEYQSHGNSKAIAHAINGSKKRSFVNKKFRNKILAGTIITLSITTIFGISKILEANKDNKDDLNIPNTVVEEINDNNQELAPLLSNESLEQIKNNENNITENVITNDIYEPTMTISFPKASNTNTNSDYTNYYNVKEKYGLYIDKLSRESGIDSRIIIAMIAQENPNQKDESNVGTYGPMCVTSIHNGETYNYGYFNSDGQFVNKNVTIDINNLKSNSENNQLYENGLYGNITNAEAMGIFYGVVIQKNNFEQINNANKDLNPIENYILSIAAYNHGYPNIIRNTKNFDNLFDASYSIRYNHAGDENYDDDQYLEHVLNKIPDEELDTPFTITSNDNNSFCFKLERNTEIATITSNNIINTKSL